MTIEEIVAEVAENPLADVTLSGGEPFLQAEQVALLAKELKKAGKNIWIYSGYTFEQLKKSQCEHTKSLLKNCDVLVDGPFILAERDLSLSFRGSRNQNIIDLNKVSF